VPHYDKVVQRVKCEIGFLMVHLQLINVQMVVSFYVFNQLSNGSTK